MSTLKRALTLYGLTMIAVGSCIGSGIFVTPGQIATHLPNASLIIAVWAVGGLVCLTGALTYAELGGMWPGSGGVYVYLTKGLGDWAGFLYGWVMLTVVNTGALAGLGVSLAEYVRLFVPDISEAIKSCIAIGVIVVLTLVNILGVDWSQRLSNVFTGLKLGAILMIVLAGVLYQGEHVQPIDFSLAYGVPSSFMSTFFLALVGVLFSVGGWHHATFVSGEVRPIS
jgi:basic amino acid/polyamine antiporter, APA family